nr:hypothetical protein [Acinetobacter sp. Marseille-Q1620]
MKKNDLENYLSSIGVHYSSYSLGSLKNSECVSVIFQNDKWEVYYTERDKPEKLADFDEERLAYDYVANLFKTWMHR